jgi:hypothetical protein
MERHRDRTDNQNPNQSQVAQLVPINGGGGGITGFKYCSTILYCSKQIELILVL